MTANRPTISILIPIYNQDIFPLVKTLTHQASLLQGKVEIIAVDDGSQEIFRKKNALLKDKYKIYYEELPHNIGRSAIRNYMAQIASEEYLLFLDGDSIIEKADFLNNYLDEINNNGEAVYCGGTYFQKKNFEENKMLHWTYGTKVISVLHSKRRPDGRFHFMSSNFLIKKERFEEVRFDETLRDYGHEDTIFGYELKKREVEIIGINNPVLHNSLDTNEEFLEKVGQSVFNLKRLKLSHNYDEYLKDIRLIITARKLSRSGMTGIYRWFFDAFNALIFRNLNGSKPSLRLLNIYKLYLYSKKVVKSNENRV